MNTYEERKCNFRGVMGYSVKIKDVNSALKCKSSKDKRLCSSYIRICSSYFTKNYLQKRISSSRFYHFCSPPWHCQSQEIETTWDYCSKSNTKGNNSSDIGARFWLAFTMWREKRWDSIFANEIFTFLLRLEFHIIH